MCLQNFSCFNFGARDLEAEIEYAIDEVKSQYALFQGSIKISNDLSAHWNNTYVKYIDSLEEFLRQVRLQKAIDKFNNVIDISYESYEYPKSSNLSGINLPIAPTCKEMSRG